MKNNFTFETEGYTSIPHDKILRLAGQSANPKDHPEFIYFDESQKFKLILCMFYVVLFNKYNK